MPGTRDLVGMTLSAYSWRIIVGTMRDKTDVAWLVPEVISGARITEPVLDEIADALVKNLFGHPRWVVQRIWRETIGMWREMDAELGARGVDLLALAPDRATNIAFGQLRRSHSGKPEDLRRWLAQLEEPPARAFDTTAGEQAAADGFLAAMARLPGAPKPKAPPVDSELTIT